MNKLHPSKHPPLNSHCRAACRCSPNSAGPSWLPGDTADIHKNRVKVGGWGVLWGCWGVWGGVRWKSAICRCRINNEKQKSRSIAALRTNSSATVPDITSAVRLCARIQCFCKSSRESRRIPDGEMEHRRADHTSLWRHQGFLPATTVRYPPLLSQSPSTLIRSRRSS